MESYEGKSVLITDDIKELFEFVRQKAAPDIKDFNRKTFRKKVKRHEQAQGKIKKVLVIQLNNYHFLATIDDVTIIDCQAARKKNGDLQMYWKYLNKTAKTKVEKMDKHIIDHSIYE